MVLGDPLSRVLHRESNLAGQPSSLDPNRPICRRMTHGVHEQVLQDTREMGGTVGPLRARELGAEKHTLPLSLRLDRSERGGDDIVQPDSIGLSFDRDGVDLDELEEIVDEGRELTDRSTHLSRVASERFPIVHHSLVDRLRHRAQVGEWGSQIVRDRRDQIASGAFDPLLLVADTLETGGHAIERLGEPVELRAGVERTHPRRQIAVADRSRRRRHRVERG